jgi:RNA polymerase sigma-B factor
MTATTIAFDSTTSRATVQDLLRERADLPPGHPARAGLRARGIEAGLPMARRLAAHYRGRGEPLDDLYQVAYLALVVAVDGYDPTRSTSFTAYAVPTITGALKRHFRDTTWRVRVPRRIQELAVRLTSGTAGLAQQLGHSPTLQELAVHLDTTATDIATAREAWRAYRPESLDTPIGGRGESTRTLADTLGTVDTRIEAVIDQQTLRPLLARLPARERRILAMRYGGELSQAEIATHIGVSQMHISRLLARSLAQLRAGLDDEQPTPATPVTPVGRSPAPSCRHALTRGVDNDDRSRRANHHRAPSLTPVTRTVAAPAGTACPVGRRQRRISGDASAPRRVGRPIDLPAGRGGDTWPLRAGDPARVDGHRLVSRLGAGGMADVFLAVAPTGDPVVIKILRPARATSRTCEREYGLARAVDPGCTAPPLGHGVSAAGPYLLTAHLPRYRCATTLLGAPLPARQLWALGAALARVLAAVHARGIVHCDVKPSNLLVRGRDVRLIDFGIARRIGERCGEADTVQSGTVQFSRGRAAPEQLRTEPATPAVDVFAWGCLLAVLAGGVHPFASRDLDEWIVRVLAARPDLAALPAGVDEVIRWSLARDPRHRPTATDLAAACQTHRARRLAPPSPTTAGHRSAAALPGPDAAAIAATVQLTPPGRGDDPQVGASA